MSMFYKGLSFAVWSLLEVSGISPDNLGGTAAGFLSRQPVVFCSWQVLEISSFSFWHHLDYFSFTRALKKKICCIYFAVGVDWGILSYLQILCTGNAAQANVSSFVKKRMLYKRWPNAAHAQGRGMLRQQSLGSPYVVPMLSQISLKVVPQSYLEVVSMLSRICLKVVSKLSRSCFKVIQMFS